MRSLVSLILFAWGTSLLYAQDSTAVAEDPYADYSYLWADDKKKKEKKKKEKKPKPTKAEPLVVIDTLGVDSLVVLASNDTIPMDSLNALSDSLDIVGPAVADETAREKAERERIDASENFKNDFRAGLPPAESQPSFSGGFTYTRIGNEDFVGLTLAPEFSIGKVGVGLNVPLMYGLSSNEIRTDIFEDGVGPARVIRYVRYGVQKRDPVYVKVGELDGVMIGYGGLVNQYTNTTSFEKRKLGLHWDVNWRGIAGLEGMYSDFDPASFNLLAMRPYVRPFATFDIPIVNTFEVGAVFVRDRDQVQTLTSDSTSVSYAFTEPGVGGFGFDAGVTLFRIPFIQIDLYTTFSRLNVASDTLESALQAQNAAILAGGDTPPSVLSDGFKNGNGFSVGFNFRFNFIANILSTDARIERLIYGDHFESQFFDASYELNKDAKLLGLGSLEGKSGIYGSLTGHVLQKVQLGGSLLIPDDISETSPARVSLFAKLERLADKFSMDANYVKGQLTDLGDAFKLDERSLAKVKFTYHLNSFLETGVIYYWAFAVTENGSYESTRFAQPFFGVNIQF